MKKSQLLRWHVFEELNILNKKLQGKEKKLLECIDKVNGFLGQNEKSKVETYPCSAMSLV